MKTTTKILILFTLTFCVNRDLIAQEGKYSETVIIKMIDYHLGDNSKLIIIKPDDTIETKLLDKAKITDDEEGVKANDVKLRQELQKWHNNGFVIKSSTSTSFRTISIMTIFLQKN
ncbi:MAG: hypothetical protein V4635_15180 [Bacteroidota bacterium]